MDCIQGMIVSLSQTNATFFCLDYFFVNHAERMVIGGYLDVFALLIIPEEGSEICGGCEM